MREKTISILLAVLVCSLCASADYKDDLTNSLVKHTVVLRNYYTDPNLKFDSEGKLRSPARTGLGPYAGRIYIEKVDLRSSALVISGQRTFPIYDASANDFRLTLVGDHVNVEIALPPDKPPSETVPGLLDRVFVPNPELHSQECSADEEEAFHQLLRRMADRASREDALKEPPSDKPYQFCFLGGEKAYRVGQGVTAPKAIETPDPEYPGVAQENRIQGGLMLLLVVDAQGRPTTPMIILPGGHGFDEAAIRAVQGWKFQPGTLNGVPVPVVVNIVINFRLR
jgi:TonB family protein